MSHEFYWLRRIPTTSACSSGQHSYLWRRWKTAEFSCCACREVSLELPHCSSVWNWASPTGNFDKLGHLRKDELWESCRVFGIKPQDITLLNCTQLQDDPKVEWKVEILSQLILNHVETLDIDLLITFDKDGISQHKNHQAIYYATAALCLTGLMPLSCKILVLETVNVIRKFLSLFDVFITLLLSTTWWVGSSDVLLNEQHVSQSTGQF